MRFSSALLACALAAGCAPYSSYPPVEETSGLTHPTFEPVPTIIVKAIEWGREREKGEVAEAPLAFTLPSNSSEISYEKIEGRIEGSRRAEAGEQAIDIRSVRVRGFDATVDIAVPRDMGDPILYSLSLKSMPFEKWKIVSERRWRFHEKDMAAVKHAPPADASASADEGAE